jgi:hypothetical protein
MRDLLGHFVAMLRNPKLVALHFVVNAALLTAASFWLLIPEAHVWQLLLAAFSALLILFVFLWLHSGTLAYAADPAPEKFRAAFSIKIGRLLWFLLGFGILFWCVRTVDGWSDSVEQVSGYIYSSAPHWLRPTSGDSGYTVALGYLFSIVQWYLLPCVFLPVIAARVAGGSALRGLRALGQWKYWLGMAVTSALGVWVTSLIVGWTPGRHVSEQTVSLVIRLGLAYAIATAAWLATAGLVGYFVGPADENDVWLCAALWKAISSPGEEARMIVRHCVAVIRDWRLWALQLIGVIVAGVVSALNPADGPTWQMVAAIAGGLLLLTGFLWLHSGTLAYAAEPRRDRFRAAFRLRIRRVAWLLLGLITLLVLIGVTESLLRMVGSGGPGWLVEMAVNLISWYLVPCLVLPWIMAKVGTDGGFRAGLRAIRRWHYWVGMAAIIFCAEWVSDWLPVGRLVSGPGRREIIVPIMVTIGNLPYVVGWVLVAGLLGYFVGCRDDGAGTNVVGKAAS